MIFQKKFTRSQALSLFWSAIQNVFASTFLATFGNPAAISIYLVLACVLLHAFVVWQWWLLSLMTVSFMTVVSGTCRVSARGIRLPVLISRGPRDNSRALTSLFLSPRVLYKLVLKISVNRYLCMGNSRSLFHPSKTKNGFSVKSPWAPWWNRYSVIYFCMRMILDI